ncbi:MAG: glutaminyl-peptide cyclotransferase [Bacteroidales bacterium]|nr:glutaminyl-peptide cyclotransferase [Bacteroidales bacterium]
MKRTAFPIVLIFSMFIVFFSCSNTPKRSRKPVSVITIEPNKKSYVFGEKVLINVKTKVKNGEIESIKLYYKNQLLKESKELDFSFEGAEISTLGNSNFKVETVKTDGLKNTRTKTIKTVSNIETKIYDYKIVNKYPHSINYYTQGLEFYNGFIYEGTGENGSSGLFKIDVKSGKTVQSYRMDDKYFGEGITILNDKIYQLTYRSQKGFVYNLSDFALIDSFQYKSTQGWGLTNDGTNLIMSDGTHVLTLLNPDDFSVKKTIQVANNKDIMNNLNELEYIDGTIFANIYMTDLIVEIDPETGKILSEVNLKGIINMYHNQNDRIDYMNGIAYDSENKRFFITGKLWPRLFEIEMIPSED